MPAQPQEKHSHGILCGLVRKHLFFSSVFSLTELFSHTLSAGCKNSCVCLNSKRFFYLKEQKKFVLVKELIFLAILYSKFNTVWFLCSIKRYLQKNIYIFFKLVSPNCLLLVSQTDSPAPNSLYWFSHCCHVRLVMMWEWHVYTFSRKSSYCTNTILSCLWILKENHNPYVYVFPVETERLCGKYQRVCEYLFIWKPIVG